MVRPCDCCIVNKIIQQGKGGEFRSKFNHGAIFYYYDSAKVACRLALVRIQLLAAMKDQYIL